jgi:rrf2 family protein (putative transcriptional regulator)
MKPTAQTSHATRILFELAHHEQEPPLRASKLSEATGISVKLLEKVIRPLKSAGLVKGVRGATGGYVLGRAPAEITLADVLITMEGAVFKPQCCRADADCDLGRGCPAGGVWSGLAHGMEMQFRSATLADFMTTPCACATPQKAGGEGKFGEEAAEETRGVEVLAGE